MGSIHSSDYEERIRKAKIDNYKFGAFWVIVVVGIIIGCVFLVQAMEASDERQDEEFKQSCIEQGGEVLELPNYNPVCIKDGVRVPQ